MKIPRINTTKGKQPVTVVPDNVLVEGFLNSDAPAEYIDVVRLLEYAEPDAEKNGAILRQCLEGKARLLPAYPGVGEKEPTGAKLVGSIMDGGLYLVPIR
ncbi:hypothetical protein [uncultured Alistipes sp.]|uniref:hypothetical protein n=1 Tax=uncultured Alistipes sp. TaxID=538949 RepID=UPI00322009D3